MVNERVAGSRQKSVAKLFFVVGLLLLFALAFPANRGQVTKLPQVPQQQGC
jgi:hypothetical protein